MDKQRLVQMITDYLDYRDKLKQAHCEWLHNKTTANTDLWCDLIMENDDRWQQLINYIYAEEKEEE